MLHQSAEPSSDLEQDHHLHGVDARSMQTYVLKLRQALRQHAADRRQHVRDEVRMFT